METIESDTFWSAARAIVEQTFLVLAPGAHAVWVTKMFIRRGERVDFPGQWRQLCESVGFVTVCEHRAWLVEESGPQLRLEGGETVKRTERMSFFRRLHAKRYPHLKIEWEQVTCMVRP